MVRLVSSFSALSNHYGKFDDLLDECMNKSVDDFDKFEGLCRLLNTNVPSHYAFQRLCKVLSNKDSNSTQRVFSFLEYGVKRASNQFRMYAASADFFDFIHGLMGDAPPHVSRKILYYVEFLKLALIHYPGELQLTKEFYNILRIEGFEFPVLDPKTSYTVPLEDFCAEPPWLESEWCQECDKAFTTLRRKHHCRMCGGIYCGDCASRSYPIIRYKIIKNVRVCDSCYKDIIRDESRTTTAESAPRTTIPSTTHNAPLVKSSADSEFEKDLERAIHLSLAENTRHQLQPKAQITDNYYPNLSEPTTTTNYKPKTLSVEPTPSMLVLPSYSRETELPPTFTQQSAANDGDFILDLFHKNTNLFEKRLSYLRSTNQLPSRDACIQGIIQTLLNTQVQLYELQNRNIKEIDDLKMQLSKLDLIKEGRKTLEGVKQEHLEKMRQQKEEADMFLRIQMEQKMELARQQRKEVEDIQKSLQNKLRLNIDSKLKQDTQTQEQRSNNALPYYPTHPTSLSTENVPAMSIPSNQSQPGAFPQTSQPQQVPVYYYAEPQGYSYPQPAASSYTTQPLYYNYAEQTPHPTTQYSGGYPAAYPPPTAHQETRLDQNAYYNYYPQQSNHPPVDGQFVSQPSDNTSYANPQATPLLTNPTICENSSDPKNNKSTKDDKKSATQLLDFDP